MFERNLEFVISLIFERNLEFSPFAFVMYPPFLRVCLDIAYY